MDVSNEESVKNGFQFVTSNFDRLDIMVNCAGIVGPSNMTCEDIPTAEFDKVYEGIEIYSLLHVLMLKYMYCN